MLGKEGMIKVLSLIFNCLHLLNVCYVSVMVTVPQKEGFQSISRGSWIHNVSGNTGSFEAGKR